MIKFEKLQEFLKPTINLTVDEQYKRAYILTFIGLIALQRVKKRSTFVWMLVVAFIQQNKDRKLTELFSIDKNSFKDSSTQYIQ
jgi:hypothetical protein